MNILWDWNGTLLNDLDFVVELSNKLFGMYGLNGFETAEDYQKIFRFPVKEYYRDMGITDEMFPAAAKVWADWYGMGCCQCDLREDAQGAVDAFHKAGCFQGVLSASNQGQLDIHLNAHPRLLEKFQAVKGLQDIYAVSKVALGKALMKEQNLNPLETCLIGDTLHDAQVATELRCGCVLVSGGHQSKALLASSGRPVVDSLMQAVQYILYS